MLTTPLSPSTSESPTTDPNRTTNRAAADPALRLAGLTSLLFTGAIFGFFYAWVCSTMWGLDNADPRVAIEAMQAMNASVRNAVFFPAFFLTPVALGLTALQAHYVGAGKAARHFGLGATVYVFGGLLLTMAAHVPMNEALALVDTTVNAADAETIWADYSGRWQLFNVVRTLACGVALVLAGAGLLALGSIEGSRER